MARIEQNESQQPTPGRTVSFFRILRKLFIFLIRIPFKLSLRLLFLAIFAFLFIQVIRAGIVRIPYVSNILYSVPKPTRVVSPVAVTSNLLFLRAKELATTSSEPTMRFTEAELTAIFSDANTTLLHEPFQSAQFVILKDSIELFGNLRSNPNLYITAYLKPSVESNRVKSTLERVYVGNVRIPQALLSSSLSDYIASRALAVAMPPIGCQKLTLYSEYLDCAIVLQE